MGSDEAALPFGSIDLQVLPFVSLGTVSVAPISTVFSSNVSVIFYYKMQMFFVPFVAVLCEFFRHATYKWMLFELMTATPGRLVSSLLFGKSGVVWLFGF